MADADATQHPDVDRAWWKEAVVYQVYPWSFNDSDGDGIGDIPGIIEKLDYLETLGVDVVWLNPVYESPKVDNGYDISDYRAILDEFGTMADWERLLAGVHDRGMRLIMDLAVNHTSDEHAWFARSRANPDGHYGDYYIWAEGDEPPNNWESFFGGSAWAYDEVRDAYYLHLYHERQPDLNWANPDVREELYGTMRWWLEKGIDGFRLDVINVISKPPDLPDGDPRSRWVGSEHFVNGPHVGEYLGEMRERVFDDYDCMVVGEMPEVTVDQAREYVGDGGAMDMVFNFDHMRLDFGETGRWAIGDWSLTDLKAVVTEWQEGLTDEGWNSFFLENHDQPRIVSRFGDDGEYRRESAKLLATLLLTLRATPFVYQGGEIGMTNCAFDSLEAVRDIDTIDNVRRLMEERGIQDYDEVRELVEHRSRDNARTPMQWSAAEHAGFSAGEPWITVNPNYPEVNVERARADPDSVWHYYRDLIALRDENDLLVYGEYDLLVPDHEQVYAYTRTLGEDRALVVLNVSPGEPSFEAPDGLAVGEASLLIGNYPDAPGSAARFALRPYEARVYRLH